MNRNDLAQKALTVAGNCLKEKGYIALVDVFMGTGLLTREDYQSWRMRQVPHLERVIKTNLAKISVIGRAVQANSIEGNLKPSRTVYTSWGKGQRQILRFSKRGDAYLEEVYSTHYLKRAVVPEKPATLAVGTAARL